MEVTITALVGLHTGDAHDLAPLLDLGLDLTLELRRRARDDKCPLSGK